MITLIDKSQIITQHIQGKSNTDIAAALGIHRNTVNKYVKEFERLSCELKECDPSDMERLHKITEAISSAPTYDAAKRKDRKWNARMDSYLDGILESEKRKNKALGPNKQALTGEQIHQLMIEAGFDIGLSTVRNKLRAKRNKTREAFIAQHYEFGQRFEYDFGEVKLMIGGVHRKLYLAVMCAPASDYRFALLYDNQRKQVFLDSQVRFFEHMGGCFKEGVYDNMRNVVKKFVGRNDKELNEDLMRLAAYYGFAINVTNCFAGNEKGSVERSVEIVRNAAFALEWEFESIVDARRHLDKVLVGLNADKPIEAERANLTFYRPAYEVADIRDHTLVDKYSCVAYENNRYSVPEVLVGKKVSVKGYPNEVIVMAGGIEVARHERLPGKGGMHLEVFHYLGTFTRKPGAIPNSVALRCAPELKDMYDRYYKARPREFVEILHACKDMGIEATLEELAACSGDCADASTHAKADAIAAQTLAQLALVANIGKGLCNVG